jgi:hypothetical protein
MVCLLSLGSPDISAHNPITGYSAVLTIFILDYQTDMSLLEDNPG